jgi:hypothetical protein
LQTIAVNYFHDKTGVNFERHRLELPDGDFVDIDLPQVEAHPVPTNAPTLLVVHGLGGEARGGYMVATYREMAKSGIRTVGLNLRGCSGEPNRKAQSYHLGATSDLTPVWEWVMANFPAPYAQMGFSLGGNLSIKYAGEQSANLVGKLSAIIAVSPPFEFKGKLKFNDFPNQIYRRYLLEGLKEDIAPKLDLLKAAGINTDLAMQAKTIEEYDRYFTAPLYGFADERDYYYKVMSGQFVSGIAIPALIIRSVDDPFFYDDVPRQALAANPNVTALITAHGGHCGFIEGLTPRNHVNWAHEMAVEWLGEVFKKQV